MQLKFLQIIASLWMLVFLIGESVPAQSENSPEKFVDLDNSCESNIARLDKVHSLASEKRLIIAIARMGNGERSSIINKRRLYNMRLWLEKIRGRPADSIITAIGDRVKGRGRIEIYVDGKLVDVIGLGMAEDLYAGSCDGTGEFDHLYFNSRRRKSK